MCKGPGAGERQSGWSSHNQSEPYRLQLESKPKLGHTHRACPLWDILPDHHCTVWAALAFASQRPWHQCTLCNWGWEPCSQGRGFLPTCEGGARLRGTDFQVTALPPWVLVPENQRKTALVSRTHTTSKQEDCCWFAM